MFSHPVGTTVQGKEVMATMTTAPDGPMNIVYHCPEDNAVVGAGDFVWGPKALAFKKSFGFQGGIDEGPDEGMAKAFMNVLEHGDEE